MQNPLELRDRRGVHSLADDLTIEWLDDLLHIITIHSTKRETLDAYYEANVAIIRNWSADQPYLTVQDVSSPRITVTSYVKAKASLIWKVAKETGVEGVNVVVLKSDSPLGMISRAFVNTNSRLFKQKIQIYFETDRAMAIARLNTYREKWMSPNP